MLLVVGSRIESVRRVARSDDNHSEHQRINHEHQKTNNRDELALSQNSPAT